MEYIDYMPQLIRATQIHTKNGECAIHITLDINLNLTTEGLKINGKATQDNIEEKEEETVWAIPTFKSEDKIKFGKKKEE